jgi:hypothetical protein
MNTDSNGLKHEAGLREDLKITLWRVLVALLSGLILGFVFMYLFFNITPRIAESVGAFIGRMLGLGFEGAPVELRIIVVIAVAFFSLASWAILRKWGPLRHQAGEMNQ